MTIFKPFGYFLAALRLLVILGSLVLVVCIGFLLMKLKMVDQTLGFKIRTFWCRMAIWMFGINLHKSGVVSVKEGTLFVSNHRSLIDPFIAFNFITNGYVVSKAEVASYPFVHTGAVLSGVIYVERTNAESRNHVKFTIEKYLSENKSIIIFPEGTVSTDTKTLPFKKGSFVAAAATHHPVVAFAIEMGNPKTDFWFEDNLLLQYFITYSKWKTDVYVHFFDPITSVSGEELKSICENNINQKLMEFQTNWN